MFFVRDDKDARPKGAYFIQIRMLFKKKITPSLWRRCINSYASIKFRSTLKMCSGGSLEAKDKIKELIDE